MDASAILGLWEEHRGLDAIRRSAALCATVDPAVTRTVALDLSLGERNARLLRLRSTWNENNLEVTARCPHCDAALEFNVDPTQIIAGTERREVRPVRLHNRVIHWRPVNSNDLLLAAAQSDDRAAARTILNCCVEEQFEDDEPLPDHEPTDPERAAIAAAIEESDPLCELLFELACVECGEQVVAEIQVPDVVWNELDAMARRLVSEVHTLATAYGWTEADCLALSPSRRAIYLETAGAT